MAAIEQAHEPSGSSGAPPRENLIRARHDGDAVTVTRSSEDAMPTLTGHAAVFNQWTEINSVYEGRFLERLAPGAFSKTIGENRDRIKVLFQHGQDPQIGDKPLGSIRALEEDSQGLRYEVELLDTAYNRDLIPGLDAGLYGASFRFSVVREDVKTKPAKSGYNPRGLTERTVTELRMPEFGPVTFPAYAGASAGLRSLTDEFMVARYADSDRLAELLGFTRPELRFDSEDIQCLAQMIGLAAEFIDDQDETADAALITEMQAIVGRLSALLSGEITETEPAEYDEMNSAPLPDTDSTRDDTEPEPSEVTTHSDRDLFWFAKPPAYMLRSK